jgi:hypothetical protein
VSLFHPLERMCGVGLCSDVINFRLQQLIIMGAAAEKFLKKKENIA